MTSTGEIKIEAPYVVSTFVDMQFLGVCVTVSFDALRKKMIQKGQIDEKAIDSKFFVLIGLKVSLLFG